MNDLRQQIGTNSLIRGRNGDVKDTPFFVGVEIGGESIFIQIALRRVPAYVLGKDSAGGFQSERSVVPGIIIVIFQQNKLDPLIGVGRGDVSVVCVNAANLCNAVGPDGKGRRLLLYRDRLREKQRFYRQSRP